MLTFRLLAHIWLPLIFLGFGLSNDALPSTHAAQWTVPFAGNSFLSSPEGGQSGVGREALAWKQKDDVYSIYFHVDRAAEVELSILARSPKGLSRLMTSIDDQKFETEMEGKEFRPYKVGAIQIVKAGYCRVDLQSLRKNEDFFVELKELQIASTTTGLTVDFVASNEGQMFYWGRRGPSVHLRYDVPKALPIEFAYSEIKIPKGLDPIGSYFMANGFGEGYFGIQVNSDQERRVLFSVWSPFNTDNPNDIPVDQRIVALASGPEVHLGEFGNEGSGGQSYLRYPWKSELTYRFLTQVKPDGQGNTVYAAWFSEASAEPWRLIAKFRRPKTDTHLTGFHSFLENFDPTRGHLERRGLYGNQWVRDTNGQWHECTSSWFSVDATGRGRHRLDFSGGSEGNQFYLRNCGFFMAPLEPGTKLMRDSATGKMPEIDFESLP